MTSIIVRPFEASDQPAVSAMYKAQGLDYAEPDWPKMLVSSLVEVDGKVEMAAFLRKVANAYLLFDPKAVVSKRNRIAELLIVHRELMQPAKRVGFDEVEAFVPPAMDDRFGKLLKHLGWQKTEWPCYSYSIEAK